MKEEDPKDKIVDICSVSESFKERLNYMASTGK